MKEENPWNVQSLYDLQYFNCPSPFCIYKNNSKQKFINHVYKYHQEADQYLRNINDGSTSDVEIPVDIKFDPTYNELEIKHEIFDEISEKHNSQIVDPKLSFYDSYVALDILKEENYCDQCNIIFCNQSSLREHDNLVHTVEIQSNDELDVFDYKYSSENDVKENMRNSDVSEQEDDNMENQLEHQCEHCGKSFSKLKNLKRHRQVIHVSKDYKCEFCGKAFSLKSSVKFHIHKVHGGNKVYKCDSCGRTLTTLGGLKYHNEICDTFNKKACDVCGKLVEERLMDYHKIRVHIKPHKCEICGKKFGVASVLKKHIKKHAEAEDGAKEIKCDYCQWTTKFKYNLKKHFETKHAINVDEDGNTHVGKVSKKVQCLLCEKWVINLERHKGRNHSEKVDIQCDHCGKPFDNILKLKDHVKTYHNSKEMLKCPICGNLYKVKRDLEVHIKSVHDKIRDHQCDTCGAAFPAKGSLKKHIREVHLGERPYKCDVCGKTYKAISHVKSHKKSIHDRIFDQICTYCGKAFSMAADLKTHSTVVHEGIKKWKCDECPIAYGQSHQLKKHYIKTHNKIYHISRFKNT